jgi:hypothetical protein
LKGDAGTAPIARRAELLCGCLLALVAQRVEVGYRIARACYRGAKDQRAALATLIELEDPRAILAANGWRPGDPVAAPQPASSAGELRPGLPAASL